MPPGEIATGWTEPTKADVPRGEVVVYDPPPARQYLPTEEEQDFARAYVKCGRRQGFAATVAATVKEVLSQLEVQFAGDAASLADRLTQVSRSIRSTATLGEQD